MDAAAATQQNNDKKDQTKFAYRMMDVGRMWVGVAAAVIIFPCLYLANFFLNILQKVKT